MEGQYPNKQSNVQLWGAGAMTGTGCCCGVVTGSTGGYLVGIVDVNRGEVWDICAACNHVVLLAEVLDPYTMR